MATVADGYIFMYGDNFYSLELDAQYIEDIVVKVEGLQRLLVFDSMEAAECAQQDAVNRIGKQSSMDSTACSLISIVYDLEIIPFCEKESEIEEKGYIVEAEWLL